MSIERDPLDLRGEAEAEKRRALEEKAHVEQEREDLVELMSTVQGRRFAWRLLARTGVHRNPFSGDRGVTDFNCGQMNIGQWFQAEILEHAPDAYLKMLKEAKPNE